MPILNDREQIQIRSYDSQIDRARVEHLQRRCEVVGPKDNVFLYTDSLGDPFCRIRNSPIYTLLVAELKNEEIVGLIQGSIKHVRLENQAASKELAKLGYVLGLRVCPLHRRKGIGSMLAKHLEEWFISNNVDLAYMATEKDNQASVKLFINKLGYTKFRTPSILVHPSSSYNDNYCSFTAPKRVEIVKISNAGQAESLYRNYMGSAEFFPHDIDKILKNKLSLGTWVAYYRNEQASSSPSQFGIDGMVPESWAMLSVWNSGGLFKLRLGKAPLSCFLYAKGWKLIHMALPCFDVAELPDFEHDDPFGFYFMYGLHRQGPKSSKLVRALCRFVHTLGAMDESQDCKLVVTEIGGGILRPGNIPHWKFLSCSEDLWCIKALKNEEKRRVLELTRTHHPTRPLFVDPREV